MKTFNILVGGLFLAMLTASSCAILDRSAVEQEEIISQIQKEQIDNPVPQNAGTWVDANGWENEAMNDGD